MQVSPEIHVGRIDGSIAELSRLSARTSSPAHIAHQFIGTVVDNTSALLTAPANSLDHGTRRATFSEFPNWQSLMKAVHRSFFSSIHLATERGLAVICEEQSIHVESSAARCFDRELAKLIEMVGDDRTVKQIHRLSKSVPRFRPTFDVNAVLKQSTYSRESKRTWRSFFHSLTIARNKSAHSDPSLTRTEARTLVDGGCGAMVSDRGTLIANPMMYNQVACHVLDFFDVLTQAHEKAG